MRNDAHRILPPAAERPRFVCAYCRRPWPEPLRACRCGNDIRVPYASTYIPAPGVTAGQDDPYAIDPGPLVEASTSAGAICWIAVACAAMAAILAALVLLKHL